MPATESNRSIRKQHPDQNRPRNFAKRCSLVIPCRTSQCSRVRPVQSTNKSQNKIILTERSCRAKPEPEAGDLAGLRACAWVL